MKKLAENSDAWLIAVQLKHDSLTVKELADLLDQTESTTFRILKEMALAGYVYVYRGESGESWHVTRSGLIAAGEVV